MLQRLGALIVGLVIGCGANAAEDEVARARELVSGKHRAEAITLLESRLAAEPGDTDARTLMGTVLSWERRFDEARAHLERVLGEHPGHPDAMLALINMEMWAGNPGRARELARQAIEQDPQSRPLREAYRKASAEAEFLSESNWEVGVERSNLWFSDGAGSWREAQLSVRGKTGLGPVTARASQAAFGNLTDRIFEIEMYPRFGRRMHGFLSAGYSPGGELYARRRYAAELFRGLPGSFEASLGFRQYVFHRRVNLLTGSLGRYYGSWLFTVRPFLDLSQIGKSRSLQFGARRFLKRRNSFWDTRVGWGASPVEVRSINEIGMLNSVSVFEELNVALRHDLRLRVIGGFARQERLDRGAVWQYVLSGTFLYGF